MSDLEQSSPFLKPLTLPTLYKKTATGAIQFWEIEAKAEGMINSSVGLITTRYGQVGTDKPQETTDIIKEGKNIGKSIATTPYGQAIAEAKAKWTKQKKSGYVESTTGAANDERDELIKGGVDPMLAHHYMDVIVDDTTGKVTLERSKDAKKIKFPFRGQPKLDGIRCIAVVKDGRCTLWSRTRKPITSCRHIAHEIEIVCSELGDVVLDGELYNHELKSDFEKIASAVRKAEPTEECERLVQYHVYDMVGEGTFDERNFNIRKLLGSWEGNVRMVHTKFIDSEEGALTQMQVYISNGYEGLMLRNCDSPYENKRSYNLQKAKAFHDDEFEIVGFTEGRGKLRGHLGTWVCKTKNGDTFETPMNGEQSALKTYFEGGERFVGMMLTVRFQGYTKANNVPRFPKGHSLRDYE